MGKSLFSKIIVFLMVFNTVTVMAAIKKESPKPVEIPVYKQLTRWMFSSQTIPVPPEGIEFSRENATWKLVSGHIRLMQPTTEGRVTGLIFEGEGHFNMTIPYWVERDHLRRCSGKKDLEKIDETFKTLILRTPEPLIETLLKLPSSLAYEKNNLAENRHKIWIKRGWNDVDARVVSGLVNPDDQYLRVSMDTQSFGWLSYVFDKNMHEEIQLIKYQRKYDFEEIWVSLDRASDRQASGAPSGVFRLPLDIQRLDIEANLTGLKNASSSYREEKTAIFNTTITFVPQETGHRLLLFSLDSGARVKSVRSESGQPLAFLRRNSGIKVLRKKDRTYINYLYVQIEKPTVKGDTLKINVQYELDISNFVSGGQWYPSSNETLNDRHMVYLTARLPKKNGVSRRRQKSLRIGRR